MVSVGIVELEALVGLMVLVGKVGLRLEVGVEGEGLLSIFGFCCESCGIPLSAVKLSSPTL